MAREDTRTNGYRIRLSDDELADWKAGARAAGKELAEWLRGLVKRELRRVPRSGEPVGNRSKRPRKPAN